MPSPPVQHRRGHLVGDALRRSYRWILLGALIGGLLGFGLALLRPVDYRSTVAVLVTPLTGNPYTSEDSRDDLTSLNSEAQIVSSETVLDLTRKQFEGATEARLRIQDVSVTVPANTQILQITVTDSDSQDAQTLAQTLAETYLDYRQELAQEAVEQRADLARDQAKQVRAKLEQAQRLAATTTDEAERLVQERLADSYQNDLFNLNAELAEIENTATSPGRVTTPASTGGSSSTLARLIPAAAAALLGALLAFAVAVARERRRPWVSRAADLEPEITVLAEWPVTPGRNNGSSTAEQSVQKHAELRRLGGVVLASTDAGGAVSITSVSSDDQAVLLARELTGSIARAGVPCVLVHTTPYLHETIDTTRGGLSDVLLHGADPNHLLTQMAPNLWYLPAGAQAPAASEHLVVPTLRRVLDSLHKPDRVIVVAGPVTSSPEGAAVVAVCDVALLCVTPQASTFEDVDVACHTVSTARTELIGAVLTHRDLRAHQGTPARSSGGTSGALLRKSDGFGRQEP